MIIVEDIEAGEIHRFIVMDASLSLGIVRAGKSIQTFNPDRAFSFYNMVENQVHDFASKYSGAFKYLPRRAYDYLKEPAILGEFYQGASGTSCSSWFADLMIAKPLIRLGETLLPDGQKDANAESVRRWANLPPHSPRIYGLQDMRRDRRNPQGWGCVIGAEDLMRALKGNNRNDLLTHIKARRPIFVELGPPEDLDPILEWLVLLKEAGLTPPKTILGVRSHKEWSKEISRLLDIPDAVVLSSGASISSLSSLFRKAKKEFGKEWSKHILYASSYPETHFGDSISESISYLFSRNLAATPPEIQRILAGNMLGMLPPRPPHLFYSDNPTSVMAEEALGKSAMNELVRILQILHARGELSTSSVDYTVEDDGGTVFLDGAIVTVMDPATEKATSLSLLTERSGALMISGWKKAFTEALVKRDSLLLQTLVRANAKLDGPIYGSPAHITRFDEALLKCLQVSSPRDIMSALHFGIEIAKTERGQFLMSPEDMRSVEVKSGDYVLVLDAQSGQWYAGTVKVHEKCRERTIVVPEEDAELYGFKPSSVVSVVRYDGEMTDLSKVVFACDSEISSSAEMISYLHLHQDTIIDRIQKSLVSIDTKLAAKGGRRDTSLTVALTSPRLDSGHVGKINGTDVVLRSSSAFSEIDIILCLSTGKEMWNRDVKLKTPATARAILKDMGEVLPEVKQFTEGLGPDASRAEVAALGSLLLLNQLLYNRSDGKLGLVTFAEESTKFSIQQGQKIQNHVEFRENFASEEVTASLAYSILDTIKDSDGREDTGNAYRSIAEYLEDFGADRPTLVIMFAGSAGKYDEEHLPFLESISKQDRYAVLLFKMGNETISNDLRILKGLNAEIIETKTFSTLAFLGHVMDMIGEMVPRNVRSRYGF